jgi:hypothetical protein
MSERHSKAAIRTRAVQSKAERAILLTLAEQADDEGLALSTGITSQKRPACPDQKPWKSSHALHIARS